MANVLSIDKKIAVIGALAEGSSIRSIERITGTNRNTIMKLSVKVGQGCTAMMDTKMRSLACNRLELDEIWGFVGKKQNSIVRGDSPELGSVWTYCAIDADTKLVPAFMVGDRSRATTKAFVADVASRMANRVQVSTDGMERRRLGRGHSMTNIEELAGVIYELHGAKATHVGSVPVKEVWKGKTIWDGIVEVFDLHSHPRTHRAYAWSHATDDPDAPVRHVTVLHLPPATSPLMAVRTAIAAEVRNAAQA